MQLSKSSRKLNSIRNIFWGLLAKIIDLFFPFIVRTVFIYTLGIEYLGVNSLFSSILMLLSLSELGFGSAITYCMYEPMANNNVDEICALMCYFKKLYRRIGYFTLIAGLMIIPFLDILIKEAPSNINIIILYVLYLVNSCVTYLFSGYQTAILTTLQREDVESNINTIVHLLVYISQVIILLIFKNVYLYVGVILAGTIFLNIVRNYYVKKRYACYLANTSSEPTRKNEMKTMVLSLIGHRLQGVVFLGADNLVISFFFGAAILGMYSNYYMVISSIVSFTSVIMLSIKPSIGNYVVVENKEDNKRLFYMLSYGLMILVGWISIALCCLLQDFMHIWVGDNLILNESLVFWISVYFFYWKFTDLITTYNDVLGNWYEYRLCPYVATTVNIILNFCLTYLLGINGVVISSVVSIVFVGFPWGCYVLYKIYFKEGFGEYIRYTLKNTGLIAFVGVGTYGLCKLINELEYEFVLRFSIKVLLSMIVPAICFTWNTLIKKDYRDYLKKIQIGRKG